MLNKKICKFCANKHCKILWTNHDDERWTRKLVWCYSDTPSPIISILEDPPDNCLYKLEHLVNVK